jgi:GntP family gluconate:H+ symporter
MMLGGLIVGLFTVSTGIAYAYWANRRWEIPLRGEDAEQSGEGEDLDESNLPSLWFSLLPILLPVVLIAGQTINLSLGGDSALLKFLGDKNIALILSAGVAISLLVTSPFRKERQNIREAVQEALASGGVIILVTAAGSGFGAVLKDTGIAKEIGQLFEGGGTLILIPVAYLVTALVRTAQGSATVAMITAGGIIAPLALDTDLGYSALYLALAIGCGSKPISWANDSGFWVIGRMSGMTPLETFKSVSIMMILMSLVGLAVVLIGATLLPLV